MELAIALLGLSERVLGEIALPEELASVIAQARRLRPGAAQNRGRRLVRAALRNSDVAAIRRTLDDPRRRERSRAIAGTEEWCSRLVAGGEDALSAFVSAFPNAGRRELRQLVRNLRKAEGEARSEKLRALAEILGRAMSFESDARESPA